jgi:hypothetical protein
MQGEGDHLARGRPDDERNGRVQSAGLGAQHGADLLAQEPFQLAEGLHDLAALRDLFHHHGRRTHHGAGDRELVVFHVVDVDHLHRAVFADRLLRHQLADVGIAAAAGAEDGAANGNIVEVGDADHLGRSDLCSVAGRL